MTRFPILARLLGQTAMIALTLPSLAWAQETDLETITVTGGGSATGPVTTADTATLTGLKSATPISEVPQSVSVVPAATLAATNAAKLDGALAYVAGVVGQPYGFDSDTNWAFIRGFAATATGVYQDGLQNFSYGFGGFYVDPLLVERIEVLKGPASVLYGGSNPGGLLNYVTKRPTGVVGKTVEVGVDEQGRAWLSYDQNSVTSGGSAYRFTGKVQRVDGHGAFDAGLTGVVGAGFSTTLQDGSDVTLLFNYTNMREDHVGGAWLPYVGTVEDAPFGKIDREFNTGEAAEDWYKRDQAMATLIWEKGIGAWKVSNTTRLSWADVDESSVYAYGYAGFSPTPTDADNTLSRIFFQHQTQTDSILSDTRGETTFNTGGAEHRFMVGVDLKYFHMDQVQASVAFPAAATGLSVTDPNYGAVQPATTPYIDQGLTQKQAGLYVQDQIRWGDGWIATLNGRLDYVDTSTGVNAATGAEGLSSHETELSWRAGIAKTLPGGWTPYLTAGTYFNPQIVNDVNGNDISPETGEQIEAGLKWSPNDSTLLTLAVFEINRKNISQSVWNGAGYDYYQIGAVRSRGIELEGRGEIAKGLIVSGALTSMDVQVTDDVDATLIGKTPYATAQEMASIKVEWSPESMKGLTLTGGARWTGSSWADNANTQKVPGVTLFDVGASYEFGQNWKANLAVSNVTDKTYVSSCQTAFSCFYGEGRTASISLTHSF
ncbi:TonB-dependent siderophore receptor [Neogemmobacter tilapiae]|uniref:Ligand-gated channel n=1 Tax=Neogemmobacter tilapiae TaxID=875041 RepID=A0A918TSU3_9RHOB|nr:TonB-dependent siderophore receptor [Gemmobacter tilapiae]GHC60322.1 ligand-gated channel [Gemmobacter tilapiae]